VDTPVISLDILPTTLDALGVQPPENPPFEGKSLLPLLASNTKTHHETLYWSKGDDGEWAVRQGNWKLRSVKGQIELFNLAKDPAETTNVADRNPQLVQSLTSAFDAWIEPMADPITGGSRRWDVSAESRERTQRKQRHLRTREDRKRRRAAKQKEHAP
jgi:arylsulfatase A-like enzyme